MRTALNTSMLAVGLLLAFAPGLASGDSPAPVPPVEKITVPTSATQREVRNYKVEVKVKGRMPSVDTTDPVDIDAVYALKTQFKYGKREGDGLLPLEMGVTESEVTANGQKLVIAPNTFPKLTILLDRAWQVSDTFGIAGTRYEKSVPGINYGNIAMLFYLYGSEKPRAVGETWQTKVKLPGTKDTCDSAVTLKSVGEVDGVKAAMIRQEITWPVKPHDSGWLAGAKAVVDSSFALDNGKLLKSGADCEVRFGKAKEGAAADSTPKLQDLTGPTANIRVDISLAR